MKNKTLTMLTAIGCALSMAACAASGEEASPAGEETEADETWREGRISREEEPEQEEAGQQETEDESGAETGNTAPDDEESGGAKAKRPSAETPSELSGDLYDFQVSIDGTVYQFPMWYSDFEALGWEYDGDAARTLDSNQYTTAEVWKKDGVSVYTSFANLSMNTVPFSESMVAGITLDRYDIEDADWEILLPGGIEWGVSNADDIVAAYGDPTDTYDGDLYYKMTYEQDYYNSVSLYVFKEGDSLQKIEIENMVELEGADNSVDETVPDAVKRYEAPKELSDDFYTYTAQLEGVVYALPCPVSVLLENGFTINENNSDSVVASRYFGWVELQYNNQSYRAIVDNYADYATTVENCFVTSMEASVNGPEFDLVFPGGIGLGSSEADVKKAVDGFNCEVETSDSGYTHYAVADPDSDAMNEYLITVSDGKVISLEVENSLD